MCGALLLGSAFGFWWIVPAIAMLICLLMMFRFARGGAGCMGMGGHRAVSQETLPETRR